MNTILIFFVRFISIQCFVSHPKRRLWIYAIPALPTWIISPVGVSSLRRTDQLAPSVLNSVISSLVPRILNLLSSGLMVEKSGNSVS